MTNIAVNSYTQRIVANLAPQMVIESVVAQKITVSPPQNQSVVGNLVGGPTVTVTPAVIPPKIQINSPLQSISVINAGPMGPGGVGGPSDDTPLDLLNKIKLVDGPGSGLDADTLYGYAHSAFVKNGDAAGGVLAGTYPNPIFDSTLSMPGTLSVAGAVSLLSTLLAGATTLASLSVTNATTIGTTLTVNGAAAFNSNVSIVGNLTINGTTTTVNSDTVTIDDPIFTLGGDTAPTIDDNKDRGIEFRWHDGISAKVGFFGFDNSTGKFTFIPEATNIDEIFSGTKGTLDAKLEWADLLSIPALVDSVTGTADQVLVNGIVGTPQTGALTLTLPQSIATTSTPQFARLGLGVAAGAGIRLYVKGESDTSSDYALKIENSANMNLMSIRNDGILEGHGSFGIAYRLSSSASFPGGFSTRGGKFTIGIIDAGFTAGMQFRSNSSSGMTFIDGWEDVVGSGYDIQIGSSTYSNSKVSLGLASGTGAGAKLHVNSATEQLRIGYNTSNYTSFTVSSGGDMTIAPSGGDITLASTLSAGASTLTSLVVSGSVAIGMSSLKNPVMDIVSGVGTGLVNDTTGIRIRHNATDGNTMTMLFGVNNTAFGGANQGYGFIQAAYWGGSYANPILLQPQGGQVAIGQMSVHDWFFTVNESITVRAPTNAGSDTIAGRFSFAPAGSYAPEMAAIRGVFDQSGWYQGMGLIFATISGPDVSGTDGVERMRITSTGLVGIGMTPARQLDVTGTFGATGASQFGATLGVTGLITATAGITTPSQYISTIATGTAPFVVSSTTLIANFNADLLDGLDSTAFQPIDAELSAIAGLVSAPNKLAYFTGSGTAALTDFSAGGRALVNAAGTANTFPYFSASNVVTLAPITVAALTILDDVTVSDIRNTLLLGTMATQNSNAVTITGGNITGLTTLSSTIATFSVANITSLDAMSARFDSFHASVFSIDNVQSLAGEWLLAKSNARISIAWTVPALGGSNTLRVWDFETSPNVAVFQANDQVMIQVITRTAGTFSIETVVGTVTSYVDGPGVNEQSWTFTRGSGANGGDYNTAGGNTVAAENVVVDFGTSGNGFLYASAIDGAYGANSAYLDVRNWATSPIFANHSTKVRLGNLVGKTGVTEYGMLAGTYAATGGQFFRASDQNFDLHGIDILLWDGGVNTVKLSRSTPSFALGNPVPTAYGTGTGIWMGKDSSIYKFRVGDPAANRITWDGSILNIVGSVTATTGTIGGWAINPTTLIGGSITLDSTGTITVGTGTNKIELVATGTDSTTNINIGTGGYNNASQFFWVDASGRMSLKQKFVWDGSALTIDGGGTFSGALSAATGTFAGSLSAATGTFAGSLSAATGTFSGSITVGQSLIVGSGTNQITLVSTASDATTAIEIGTGGYNNASQFFWVDASGRMSLKQKFVWDGTTLTIDGGGTFSGALSAATGTFAGALSAATGTFAGSLSAATGTFAGSLSAATGTFSGSITVGQSLFIGSGTNKISLVSTASDATTAISIGSGGYNNVSQFFWVDAFGRMSLKQKFVWDGSALTIDGSGTFSGNLTAVTVTASSSLTVGTHATNKILLESTNTAATTLIRTGGATAYATGAGFWLDGAGKLRLGDPAGSQLTYDSGTLAIVGSILGGMLQIGGDDATSFQVDSGGGIWAGASIANKATAPFRVSNAGAAFVRSLNFTDGSNNNVATAEAFSGTLPGGGTAAAGWRLTMSDLDSNTTDAFLGWSQNSSGSFQYVALQGYSETSGGMPPIVQFTSRPTIDTFLVQLLSGTHDATSGYYGNVALASASGTGSVDVGVVKFTAGVAATVVGFTYTATTATYKGATTFQDAVTLSSSLSVVSTLGVTGAATFGPGSTGTAQYTLAINSGSGTGGEPIIGFQRGSSSKAFIGVAGQSASLVPGSVANDMIFRTQGGAMLWSADSGTTAHMTLNTSGQLSFDTAGQTNARVRSRGTTNAFEFGHPNTGGYGSALGFTNTGGYPFLAFHAEAETSGNTFRTRGILGRLIMADAASGNLLFGRLTNTNATAQTMTTDFYINSNGYTFFNRPSIHTYEAGQSAALWAQAASGGTIATMRFMSNGLGTTYGLVYSTSTKNLIIMEGNTNYYLQIDSSGTNSMAGNLSFQNTWAVINQSSLTKKNITSIMDADDSLSRIMALKPVNFLYKTDLDKPQIGLIAEWTKDIVPTVVIDSKDGLGIAYSQLTPLIISAMQAQQKEIAALRAMITEIKQKGGK